MRQQPVDAIFIDPYNSLKLDMGQKGVSSHEYHYEAASEFLTFSKANDMAVVEHARSHRSAASQG